MVLLVTLLWLQPAEAIWLLTNLPYCKGGSRVLDIAVPDGFQTFPARRSRAGLRPWSVY